MHWFWSLFGWYCTKLHNRTLWVNGECPQWASEWLYAAKSGEGKSRLVVTGYSIANGVD